MSGLTVMPSGRSLLLDRMDETSIARFLTLLKVDAKVESEPCICQDAGSLLYKMIVYQHLTLIILVILGQHPACFSPI